MLNEILEFEAYVKSPESEKPRIQPKLLTNNFNEDGNLFGIERILIVIARGYIFSKCHQNEIYNSDGMVNNELLNDTRVILQRWCGFDFDESGLQIDRESISNWFEKYPEADGWLKQYWMFHCAKKTKKEKMWNTIEKQWGESLMEKDYAEDHITLDSVIANAINRGPLRERYMVLRKDRSATPAKKEKERFTYLYSMKPGKDGKIHSLQEKTRECIFLAENIIRKNKNLYYCMEINFWDGMVLMITKENEKTGIFLNACGEIQTKNQLWKFIVKRKDGNLSKWL